MNPEKLAKLQAQVRIGGKGTPRRKVKNSHKPAVQANSTTVQTQQSASGQYTEDKRVLSALKKFPVQTIPMIEEVNMFRADGKVIHIQSPKVYASVQANCFMISGTVKEASVNELMPGILTQMGRDALASLSALAEQYKAQGIDASTKDAASGDADGAEVSNFEAVSELD